MNIGRNHGRRLRRSAGLVLLSLSVMTGALMVSVGNAPGPVPSATQTPPRVAANSRQHVKQDLDTVLVDPLHGNRVVAHYREHYLDYVLRSCGQCMPGDVPGKTIERDWHASKPDPSNPKLASVHYVSNTNGDQWGGARTSTTTISQGWGCDLLGNCLIDITFRMDDYWQWYLGVLIKSYGQVYLYGCGAPGCLNWGWHLADTYEHHGFANQLSFAWIAGANRLQYVTYQDNVHLGILGPDPSFGGHYVNREPWALHIAGPTGNYWWDAGIDLPFPGYCSYPKC